MVSILKVQKNIRIFNSRFVEKIKNIEIANDFEKLRLVVQAYNNYDKMSILIQSLTIEQISQQQILALSAINSKIDLYLRDIT